jgi:hypothetical protein
VEIPFLREILQTSTAAAVHLGLRLALASGLTYEAAAVILGVVDVCAQARRIGFKRLKGQRLRCQLASGLLSTGTLIAFDRQTVVPQPRVTRL